MKISLLYYFLFFLLLFGTLNAQISPNDEWIYKSRKRIDATAIDQLGNLFIVKFKSNNNNEFTLLKLNRNKRKKWRVNFTPNNSYFNFSISKIIATGNLDLVVFGNAINHFNLETKDTTLIVGKINPNLLPNENKFSFIITFNTSGEIKWIKTYESKGEFNNIAVNNNGEIYLSEVIYKSLLKSNDSLKNTFIDDTKYKIEIKKYSNKGNYIKTLPIHFFSDHYLSVQMKSDNNNLYLNSENMQAFWSNNKELYEYKKYMSAIVALNQNDSVWYYNTFFRTSITNFEVADSSIYLLVYADKKPATLNKISLDKNSIVEYSIPLNNYRGLYMKGFQNLVVDNYNQLHLIFPFGKGRGNMVNSIYKYYDYDDYLYRDYPDFAKLSFQLNDFELLETKKILLSSVEKVKDFNNPNFRIKDIQTNGFYNIMSGSYKDTNTLSDMNGKLYNLSNFTKKNRYFILKSKVEKINTTKEYNSNEIEVPNFSSEFVLPSVFKTPQRFKVTLNEKPSKNYVDFMVENGFGLFTVTLFHEDGGKELFNKAYYSNGTFNDSIPTRYLDSGKYVLYITKGIEKKQLRFYIYNY